MPNTIIILGSSRSHGDTRKLADAIIKKTQWDILDLNTIEMSYFDYEHQNQNDDFIPTMQKILTYDNIVFATPVYWYSMSGIMKVFFDRISDLLKIRKDLGRQLRGKSMAAISCSDDDDLNEEFFMPFSRSADYLGMHYLGDMHGFGMSNGISEEVERRIDGFIKLL
jgi:multimeric flavodoxin WrbA